MSEEREGSVSARAFAAIHGVSIFTVWRWIAEGKITAEKDPGGHCWRVIVKKRPSKTEQELIRESNTE